MILQRAGSRCQCPTLRSSFKCPQRQACQMSVGLARWDKKRVTESPSGPEERGDCVQELQRTGIWQIRRGGHLARPMGSGIGRGGLPFTLSPAPPASPTCR